MNNDYGQSIEANEEAMVSVCGLIDDDNKEDTVVAKIDTLANDALDSEKDEYDGTLAMNHAMIAALEQPSRRGQRLGLMLELDSIEEMARVYGHSNEAIKAPDECDRRQRREPKLERTKKSSLQERLGNCSHAEYIPGFQCERAQKYCFPFTALIPILGGGCATSCFRLAVAQWAVNLNLTLTFQ